MHIADTPLSLSLLHQLLHDTSLVIKTSLNKTCEYMLLGMYVILKVIHLRYTVT